MAGTQAATSVKRMANLLDKDENPEMKKLRDDMDLMKKEQGDLGKRVGRIEDTNEQIVRNLSQMNQTMLAISGKLEGLTRPARQPQLPISEERDAVIAAASVDAKDCRLVKDLDGEEQKISEQANEVLCAIFTIQADSIDGFPLAPDVWWQKLSAITTLPTIRQCLINHGVDGDLVRARVRKTDLWTVLLFPRLYANGYIKTE
eukprot:TRINITY_DN27727_c0_g3_i1.p3 TRINITY_DN27727_c0_g3~~TRINITY_DN27727_c0_g3_i1.p3  ORF type:complete len:203 (+),score=51.52 TRINITY_DN27727_c0_g3_i1:609-1217(+)